MLTRAHAIILPLLVLGLVSSPALPIGTEFTYQGFLEQGGQPANGQFDFEIELYDDPISGSPVGPTQSIMNLAVLEGVFTAQLDFGPVFSDGADLWLQIATREASTTDPFTVLLPRQKITPTPYARRSATAALADQALEANTSDELDGLDSTDFFLRSGGEVTGDIELLDADLELIAGTTLGGSISPQVEGLRISTPGNSRVRVESRVETTGSVSIGLLGNPAQMLHVNGGLELGNTSIATQGTLRWNGSDFQGYSGGQWKSLTATSWSDITGKPSVFPPSQVRAGDFDIFGNLDVDGNTDLLGDLRLGVNGNASSTRLFLGQGSYITMESFVEEASRIRMEGYNGDSDTDQLGLELLADEGGVITLRDGKPEVVPNTINQTVVLDGRSGSFGGRILVRDGLRSEPVIDLEGRTDVNGIDMARLRVRGLVSVETDGGAGGLIEVDQIVLGDYLKLDLSSGTPPSSDCTLSSHRGRMKFDANTSLLYICATSGWISK